MEDWTHLRAHVEKLMKEWHIPGAAVGVVQDGEVVFAEGFGVTDCNTGQAVTADTQFSIGSSTKSFTTTALGLLVDEGVVDWDSPVRTFMPEFRLFDSVASERVCLRDMACHRTGLPRYDAMLFNPVFTRKDILDRLRHLKPTKDLRTSWQYNNLMFAAMGDIVRRVSGLTWEEFVRQRLLTPLGMTNSSFDCDEILSAPDHAWPHREVDGKISRIEFMSIGATGPAGSINASAKDMAKWLKFNLDLGKVEGKQFLAEATIKEIHSRHIPMRGMQDEEGLQQGNYCLGWMSGFYRGGHVIQHGGATVGFATECAFMPSHKTGVVVFTNNNGPVAQFVARYVFDTVLGLEPVDWSGKAKEKRAQSEAAKVDQGDLPKVQNTTPSHPLDDYKGTYRHPGLGDLAVGFDENGDLTATYGTIDMKLSHRHYDVFDAKMPDFFRGFKMGVTFQGAQDGSIFSVALPLGFDPLLEDLVFTRVPDNMMSELSFLAPFCGDYEVAGMPLKVVLNKQGSLTVAMPGQPVITLVPYKGTTFNFEGLPGFSLTFGDNKAELTQPGGVFTANKIGGGRVETAPT
ncbi:MAG: D-alanyl-D-alanine carboxypeptidase [Firmicutes bacterium]|nr:D-alanyl-D-alanine carboxypeptidase [candidate division NPL-UPA2 bacterium]